MSGPLYEQPGRYVQSLNVVFHAYAAGCAHCCHLTVEASGLEVFLIAEHLKQRRSPAQLAGVKGRVWRTANAAAGLPPEAWARAGFAAALNAANLPEDDAHWCKLNTALQIALGDPQALSGWLGVTSTLAASCEAVEYRSEVSQKIVSCSVSRLAFFAENSDFLNDLLIFLLYNPEIAQFIIEQGANFMKPLSELILVRLAVGLAVAGAALLSAPGVFAQTTPTSFTFGVENDTYSGGDPVFPVSDSLTFSNLQIFEKFADTSSHILFLKSLDANTISLQKALMTPSSPLVSAVLTGSIGTGPMQTINTQTTIAGPTTPQYVFSNFSADLFGVAPVGTTLGVFSLTDGSNNVINSVEIEALPAVPEASTTVSLGLLLALGLGTLVAARRKSAVRAN